MPSSILFSENFPCPLLISRPNYYLNWCPASWKYDIIQFFPWNWVRSHWYVNFCYCSLRIESQKLMVLTSIFLRITDRSSWITTTKNFHQWYFPQNDPLNVIGDPLNAISYFWKTIIADLRNPTQINL